MERIYWLRGDDYAMIKLLKTAAVTGNLDESLPVTSSPKDRATTLTSL